MKLSDIEFVKLLPQFMRDDGAVKGLSNAFDVIVPALAESIDTLPTWGHLDKLSVAELDALADELNILWYDTGATKEAKVNVILESDKVFRYLGTKWAVENVINSYFGDGYITEWYQYEGEPGHFRVYSTNPALTNERLVEFLNLLDKVKRASSILDGIFITLTGEMNLYAGVAVHDVGAERYDIGASPT